MYSTTPDFVEIKKKFSRLSLHSFPPNSGHVFPAVSTVQWAIVKILYFDTLAPSSPPIRRIAERTRRNFLGSVARVMMMVAAQFFAFAGMTGGLGRLERHSFFAVKEKATQTARVFFSGHRIFCVESRGFGVQTESHPFKLQKKSRGEAWRRRENPSRWLRGVEKPVAAWSSRNPSRLNYSRKAGDCEEEKGKSQSLAARSRKAGGCEEQ